MSTSLKTFSFSENPFHRFQLLSRAVQKGNKKGEKDPSTLHVGPPRWVLSNPEKEKEIKVLETTFQLQAGSSGGRVADDKAKEDGDQLSYRVIARTS